MSASLSTLANVAEISSNKVEWAFGRTDVDLPWEHTDKVDELKALLVK
ncbi:MULTISPECIES: hypothetical protein [unclassified Lactococcus]|nr:MULTISPECIES: hypothetical protein [unclassified Lactococcus]MQW23775.1 hypothetical protein [Lactococcus sp. dk101]